MPTPEQIRRYLAIIERLGIGALEARDPAAIVVQDWLNHLATLDHGGLGPICPLCGNERLEHDPTKRRGGNDAGQG